MRTYEPAFNDGQVTGQVFLDLVSTVCKAILNSVESNRTEIKQRADSLKEHINETAALDKRRNPNIDKCTGIVVSARPDQGYGFVETSDGKKHYFHRTKFIDRALSTFPEQGDCLTFELEASSRKPGHTQCLNINRQNKVEHIEVTAPKTTHEQPISEIAPKHGCDAKHVEEVIALEKK